MGMTSEEPLTHLEWFAALLADAGLPAEEHLLVMALPGSYLDRFAVERHIPRRLLQLDGDAGTPGRFSAPTTRVFLLPAAIHLAGGTEGGLEAVLSRARELHDPDGALSDPAHHSVALLAAALSDSSTHGACRLLLRLPPPWRPLFPWIEQLLEESLGKGGKGVVAFADQPVAAGAGAITVNMASAQSRDNNPDLQLQLPCPSNVDLATVAAAYLDWQLTTALYGWLEDIKFAGQPAVENYKSRAAALRRVPDPLAAALPTAATVDEGSLHMLTPPGISGELSVAAAISPLLNQATPLSYLDLTINGELPPALWLQIDREWWAIGRRLNLPVKLRRAPSAYHATEQSEMDGPPPLLSLRLLWRLHQPPLLGVYSDHFLQCQAMATWQAMIEVGRPCFLLVHDGDAAAAAASLLALLPALFSPIP